MSAVYLMLILLCVFALAYRYYAAFIGAKVMMLDDRNIAPSVSCNDGQGLCSDQQMGRLRTSFRGHRRRGTAHRPDPGRPVRLGAGILLDPAGLRLRRLCP